MLAENSSKTRRLYRVAIPRPLRNSFVYEEADKCHALPIKAGTRVLVPFGNSKLVGVVLGEASAEDADSNKLKAILELLDSEPLLPETTLELCSWAANYYHHPIGEVLAAVMPPLWQKQIDQTELHPNEIVYLVKSDQPEQIDWGRRVRQKTLFEWLETHPRCSKQQIKEAGFSSSLIKALLQQDLIQAMEQTVESVAPNADTILAEQPLQLSQQQKQALESFDHTQFKPAILAGSTGSGKTEVYLQAAEKILRLGQQVLYLIPEIGLSPQTEVRIRNRFDCRIGVYHSGMSDKSRNRVWMQARDGDIDILLGTRSASLIPMPNLGLIVIDEEHDLSFKQQENFRYSARDLATVRAKRLNIALLLGSATPSLETLRNVQANNMQLLRLPARIGNRSFPSWQLVDSSSQPTRSGFTKLTIDKIGAHLNQGSQVLVFLNRRGFASALNCNDCGWTAECSGCSRPTTLHRNPQKLLCHHCGHENRVPLRCPRCQSSALKPLGQGTERAEAFLSKSFLDIPIVRVDRDTLSKKGAMTAALKAVHSNQPCILVGTQMLAKGHHFPNVTLVVVVDADSGLFSADFRSSERTAQLITQVSGRAGRGDKPGEALLQTQHKDHPLIQQLIAHDFWQIAKGLLAEREQFQLPPYTHMALLRAESSDANEANEFLLKLANIGMREADEDTEVIGPLSAPIEMRRNRFRFQLHLKSKQRSSLHRLVALLLDATETLKTSRHLRWSIDIDPQTID